MKRLRDLGMLTVSLGLLLGTPSATRADVVIDFEGYPGGTSITNQYAGVLFTNAIVLQAPDYNYLNYPAHSGTNVVYSGDSSSMTAASTSGTWSHVGLWYTSAITGLYLEAYDASNTLLASSFGGTNYGSNSSLDVSASGIAYVIIHDSGNFFTVDDFTYTATTTATPEPSTLAIAGLGGMALVVFARRRRAAA